MPYFWKDTGVQLNHNTGFTRNGIQYPAVWLQRSTADERTAIGLEWRADPVLKNTRWWRNSVDSSGIVVSTPLDLDALREREKASAKKSAGTRLSDSDWMVVRESETGEATPAEWKEYRQAVRAYSNALEGEIASAGVDVLVAMRPEWPLSPTEKAAREEMERHEEESRLRDEEERKRREENQ